MTSQVTIGRAKTTFRSSTALPHAPGEAGWRILLVGDHAGLVLACAGEIEPEWSIAVVAADAVPAQPGREHDVLVVACGPLDDEVRALLAELVRRARALPVVAVVDAGARPRREVARDFKALGVTEVLCLADLSSLLLEATVAHARERSELESELVSLRDRFALAVRGALDGMWEYELAEGRVYYSQRWQELLGFERGDLGDRLGDWLARIHPGDVPGFERALADHVEGRSGVFQSEHRVRTASGEYRWMLARGVAQTDENGRALRVSGSLTDVTQYRERAEELRAQSRHDGITDLPRQQVFHERLARAVEVRRTYTDYGFAVLMVQVDRFGLLQGSFGKEGADQLLALVAERIHSCVTDDEVLCRYGDDRFAILVENLDDPTEGTGVADRIHRAFEAPFTVREHRVHVTVSIGMTSSARDYQSVDDLITDVSSATDHARGSRGRGVGGHQVFRTNMRIEALTLLRLEVALREAIEREEFRLAYQPVVELAGGRLRGFEALIRWNSASHGNVSPGQFIPVAESTGLIVPIGRWAIREATRQLRNWHEEFELDGGLFVNVNVSGGQVSDPELVPTLARALAETSLDPACLKLELTESVLMDNAEHAIDLIGRLRDTGVRLVIDDFGTGYSSLSYLHRFPVDGLKVDKSFVDELDGSEQSGVMIKTILEMAENLRLEVVAEGIENADQVAQLLRLGCRFGQGYHFDRPLSPGDAYAAIARGLG